MMQHLTLAEYQTLSAVELSSAQLDALRTLVPSVAIAPSGDLGGRYDLKADSFIGVARLPDLELVIRPKLDIDRVLFLISYAMDPKSWWQAPAELEHEPSLVEAIIPGFVHQTKRALRRGLKQGYVTTDDSLLTVRGRLRIQDQITRRYGIAPPAEVTFDEYTEDIEINRLLRAAIHRLELLPVRNDRIRWPLRALDAKLNNVSLVAYNPKRVPEPVYTRLTEHYRPAVQLARLILASGAFELRHGEVASAAFLVDMNQVFEDFMVVALREALGLSDRTLVQGAYRRPFHLDEGRHVPLKPDLSWWEGTRCRFIGDIKYKRLRIAGYLNADLYQVSAYAGAAGLSDALLIYAAGEGDPVTYQVVNAGPRLRVVTVDLSVAPDLILTQVGEIAEYIRGLAAAA
jgi:5-methylcytosine-specific restriction enzyme subunit McrC